MTMTNFEKIQLAKTTIDFLASYTKGAYDASDNDELNVICLHVNEGLKHIGSLLQDLVVKEKEGDCDHE